MMTEKPILFNAEMVRAILDGRKTQTRRPVKVPWARYRKAPPYSPYFEEEDGKLFFMDEYGDYHDFVKDWPSPFGRPGDRLWVREPAKVLAHEWRDIDGKWARAIKAQYSNGTISDWIHRPSRLKPVAVGKGMPNGCFREASRINLLVKDVKVERLWDIGNDGISAEGITCESEPDCLPGNFCANRIQKFKSLWDSIYSKQKFGWETNCWVWVVEFEVIK
jgi:hypothetical protein